MKTASFVKTSLFLLFLFFCLLWTTAALGQAALGAVPMSATYQVADHPQHASPHPMAQERSLLEGSGSVYIAHGELPLWEVAPKREEIPLGDAARLQKKEHATARKARVVFEN